MKRLFFALAVSLAAVSIASAQDYIDAKGTRIPGVTIAGGPYILAYNVNAAGNTTPVTVLKNPNYILSCLATSWNGATAQLQALGPDGSTWLTGGVSALSANGTIPLSIGAGASVRISVTGTPSGLFCNLS